MLFVVSAFESVERHDSRHLDKGHTVADASKAVVLLREHGIEVRPSWLPFTPWTTFDDLVDLLDFVVAHDLVANVDPVQYTVRLLCPRVRCCSPSRHVTSPRSYDPARLGWTWSHPDPAVDQLQQELAALVEDQLGEEPIEETFGQGVAVGRSSPRALYRARRGGRVPSDRVGIEPRLTEPWFCCSEPTRGSNSGRWSGWPHLSERPGVVGAVERQAAIVGFRVRQPPDTRRSPVPRALPRSCGS